MRFVEAVHLKEGMQVGKNVIETGAGAVLKVGDVLTWEKIKEINVKGYAGVYVLDELPNEPVSEDFFSDMLSAVSTMDVPWLVALSSRLADEMIKNHARILDFYDIRSFADYIPHHSVCVAIYAVKIGIAEEYAPDVLKMLAMAGLLHDLGKYNVDDKLMNKTGDLTAKEYAAIKEHSKYSYEIIKDKPDIPDKVKEAVLYHHENENGTGYPYGKTGEELSPLAKMLHVADVFDALTAHKSYRKGYSNAEAMDYLEGGKDILFDAGIVDSFKKVVVPYTIGSKVHLSNGDEAIVLGQTADLHRPIILDLKLNRGINLYESQEFRDEVILNDVPKDKAKPEAKEEVKEESYKPDEEKSANDDFDLSAFYNNAYAIPTEEPVKEEKVVASSDDPFGLKEEKKDEPFDIFEFLNQNKEEEPKNLKKIMIVDDVAVSLIQTKGMLMDEYDVHTFNSGAAALANINYIKPDIILMDYAMPEMDGVTAVKRIREAGYKDTPVIFLTGKSDKETVVACKHVGAVDYIVKPANAVYLKARVEMALSAKAGKLSDLD